jgi:hypothetical protein
MVVAIEEKVGETFEAERGLVGMMADADGAGAHGEAAGLDAGFAESDGVGGREFAGERGERQCVPRDEVCGEEGSSGGASGAMEEFAAFHEASSWQRIETDCLSYRRARKAFGYQGWRVIGKRTGFAMKEEA